MAYNFKGPFGKPIGILYLEDSFVPLEPSHPQRGFPPESFKFGRREESWSL